MGDERLQRGLRITRQTDFYRVAETETTRIAVDLNGAGVAGLRIKFHVWKTRAHDQQRIALLERQLGRQCAEEPDSSGGEGRVIGNSRLSKEGFHDRRRQQIGGSLELVRRPRRAVELGVVEPVEQMDRSRAGGREADTDSPGVFGVATRHKCRGFLMPNLDKANVLLSDT